MMHSRRFVFAVVILLVCPALAWGNEFRLVPSVSVKEEYNDNILFSTDDAKRDFITTVSPGLEMVNNTQQLETSLLARLDRIDYGSNRELSATDQSYSGKIRYFATPLFGISATAGYTRDSRPDRDITTSGIILSTVPRNRVNASLSANYQLTETTSVGTSYTFNRDYYDSTRYASDCSHDVNVGLVHDFGRYVTGVKGQMNLGYSDYTFSDSRIDSVMGTAGLSKDFSETWSVSINAGVRRLWSSLSVGPFQLKNDGWGWVGNAALNYRGERGNGSLSYGRDISPATGLNGATERNTLTLSTQYRVTYEFSVLLSAGFYTNKADAGEFSTQDISERTFRVNPGVRYEFTKDIALEALYDYIAFDNLASHTTADRNLFSIRLYIQYPILQ